MKLHITKALAICAAIVVIASCKKDAKTTPTDEVSQAIKDKIYAVGFGTSNVQKVEEGYLVEGDIILTDEYLNSNPQRLILRSGTEEQYHTTNLVTGLPRNIKVALNSKLAAKAGYSEGLTEMVRRYNAENLQITFTVVSSGADITFVDAHGSYLASSGFPSNGLPYGQVKVNSSAIGSGSSSTFVNYLATILAHETGHCIGFRHTDYANRAYSCGGSPSNEGASTVGAVWIPNTPTGPDPNSWMLACIGSGVNRPFNNNDKTALNYLY
jgi:hypothetical protein